ncbi:LysE/ArgO family amino acid transporter [Caldinitratiruptor microaerophilus]|uniref:Arginine exporter protein ArgO n=1 Tax=Caldinitratiruptor microaerophilus TaxID=671077 RepID=A0AA35G8T8_9FIRM|nr:LysE family transporter [Caldinitratiruptor microaerophilus]BDG59584.1 arginine exporter protein ArgO [Caldinitratiruptor microaerophilus]
MKALAFLSGLLLGLSMILPIGPQNVFVLNQGLLGGLRRGLLAAVVAGVCDTVLILSGAAGLSALLTGVGWLRTVLLAVGALFLTALGFGSLRDPAEPAVLAAGDAAAGRQAAAAAAPARAVVLTGVGVSWGNPHAILDTVAVLGSAIASRAPATRAAFAAGAVAASWLFFLTLALGGALFGARLTPAHQVWVRRASGAIMLFFAVVLAREAALSWL